MTMLPRPTRRRVGLHTVAVATDMQSDYPRPKGLEQLLAVACVVTQIGEDQTIPVIASINLRQRTGAVAAIP